MDQDTRNLIRGVSQFLVEVAVFFMVEQRVASSM
jgi:hypothetical protein